MTQKALTFYPQPNNPGDPQRNYVSNIPFKRDNYQINARVDHQLSSQDSIFGRYSQSNLVAKNPGPFPDMGGDDITNLGKNVALNWVHAFAPQLVNEARAGYNRLNFGAVSTPDKGQTSGVNWGSRASLPTASPGFRSSVSPALPAWEIRNLTATSTTSISGSTRPPTSRASTAPNSGLISAASRTTTTSRARPAGRMAFRASLRAFRGFPYGKGWRIFCLACRPAAQSPTSATSAAPVRQIGTCSFRTTGRSRPI